MMLDDPLADRKPHACAFVGASPVQALEEKEYTFGMLLVKTDAVIFNEYLLALEVPIPVFAWPAVNLDRARLFSVEF